MGAPATFREHHHGLREGALLSLPICVHGGRLHHFRLRRSTLIPKELQAKFPHIRVYHAQEEGGHMSADVTVSTAGVRSQIWHNHAPGLTKGRCFVDPHTAGRADMYSVYSHADLPDGMQPHDEAADTLDNIVKLKVEQMQGSGRPSEAPLDAQHGAHRRQLTDRTELIFPPPAGATAVREYRLCIGLAPDYIAYANEMFPHDGPLGLVATTVRAAQGRLGALCVFLCKSGLYGAFVWARRALKHQKHRFRARADGPRERDLAPLRRHQPLALQEAGPAALLHAVRRRRRPDPRRGPGERLPRGPVPLRRCAPSPGQLELVAANRRARKSSSHTLC